MKKLTALMLVLCLLLGGCAGSSRELTLDCCPTAPPGEDPGQYGPLITDLGIRLLQAGYEEDQNMLLSPLSILTALAMTANGAGGETLAQMQAVLGGDMDRLNGFLGSYRLQLPEGLHMANSLWIRDVPTLTVEDGFLQTNGEYYGAGVFRAPFDHTTVKEINSWVERHTDGRIRDMLDRIPEDTMLYLVNALGFEAKWAESYEAFQVHDRDFTMGNGEVRKVSMMYSTEHHYLETENATGFLKYYEGRQYAFVALLPKEDVTLEELVLSLNGEEVHGVLTTPQDLTVYAAMPKFEASYDRELKEVLKEMGMELPFDGERADFSRMAGLDDGRNLCIGRVLHKTAITVAEEGTEAGASTMVEMRAGGAAEMPEDSRTVTLDRPFLYMIIDTDFRQPVFIGTLTDPGQP